MKTLQVLNLELDEESDESIRFFYTNSSTGLLIDLTGYRAEMTVRTGYDGSSWNNTTPALQYTTETGGGIVLGGVNGTVDVYISYEDTKGKEWTTAVYNLYLITPSSNRISFARGFFTINRSGVKLIDSALPNKAITPQPSPNNLGEGGLDSNG